MGVIKKQKPRGSGLMKGKTTMPKDNTQMPEKKETTIWEALAAAQGEMTEPAKSQEGYNYSYAPLDTVVKITRPVLAKHGLFVMQTPINVEDKIGVETMIGHVSGESFKSSIVMPLSNIVAKGNAAQQIGAAITYLRRYALMAVCGLAPEDDDAQSLPKTESKQYGGSKVTDKQIKFINTLITQTNSDKAKIYEVYKVESLKDLTASQASDLIKKLQIKNEADPTADWVHAEEPMYEETIH